MDDTTEKLIAAGFVRRVGNELEITDKGRAALRVGLAKPVEIVAGEPEINGKRRARIDSQLARARPHIRPKHKRKKH